jgi:hypothetical protein
MELFHYFIWFLFELIKLNLSRQIFTLRIMSGNNNFIMKLSDAPLDNIKINFYYV